MTLTGRRTRTSDKPAPSRRRPGGTGARWVVATLASLVLGVVLLAVGAWAISRPGASVSPWGLAGGTIAGPILIAIGVAELVRRWRRGRLRRTARHLGPR